MNMTVEIVAPGAAVEQPLTFRSGEHWLAGRLFRPRDRADAIVVLNGATGVRARYYVPFAKW